MTEKDLYCILSSSSTWNRIEIRIWTVMHTFDFHKEQLKWEILIWCSTTIVCLVLNLCFESHMVCGRENMTQILGNLLRKDIFFQKHCNSNIWCYRKRNTQWMIFTISQIEPQKTSHISFSKTYFCFISDWVHKWFPKMTK